jgi:hypothetical protein
MRYQTKRYLHEPIEEEDDYIDHEVTLDDYATQAAVFNSISSVIDISVDEFKHSSLSLPHP